MALRTQTDDLLRVLGLTVAAVLAVVFAVGFLVGFATGRWLGG